jgi:hypothetical protein
LGCAEPVAPREDIDDTKITFSEFKSYYVGYDPDTGSYIVDGDTTIASDNELLEFYLQWVANLSALSVSNLNQAYYRGPALDPKLDVWDEEQKLNLTFCVSRQFGDYYDNVVKAMATGTADWEGAAHVSFSHIQEADATCAAPKHRRQTDELLPVEQSHSVVFVVAPTTTDEYGARAFFPHFPEEKRVIAVDDSAYKDEGGWLVSVMRHELGHVLGFRHEHIRPQAGPGCPNEEANYVPVTAYDPDSIMHYRCGGADGPDTLSALDKSGAAAIYGAPP